MIRIREKFVKHMTSPYSGSKRSHFTLLENPTESEIEEVEIDDFDEVGIFYLRALVVGENLYAWYGEMAEHFYIVKELGLQDQPWEKNVLELFFPESDRPLSRNEAYKVVKVSYQSSKNFSFYDKNSGSNHPFNNLEILKSNKPLKAICSSNVKWVDES